MTWVEVGSWGGQDCEHLCQPPCAPLLDGAGGGARGAHLQLGRCHLRAGRVSQGALVWLRQLLGGPSGAW